MQRLTLRTRYRGAILGLAAGDALGTTNEFRAPGSFPPLTDMVGGGPFQLPVGAWTDDTSMALCLAESLVECGGFDAQDQMERYVRWWKHGHLSSTGTCFDIGNRTRAALGAFITSRNPWQGATTDRNGPNGSLMRLAPVPLAFALDPHKAIEMAAMSSRPTHDAPLVVDCCRYLGALIVGAIQGASKDELLNRHFGAREGWWTERPLADEVQEIADGSFRHREPPLIKGSGTATLALEAALWAFHRGTDFREGALLAVNLGDDADTTGAIYGQLAGAYYGVDGIPATWREKLALRARIETLADGLLTLSGLEC